MVRSHVAGRERPLGRQAVSRSHGVAARRRDSRVRARHCGLGIEARQRRAPKLVFSAMDASVATEIEQAFASAGHVIVSNSRNHRMDADVPLLVPEINADHLKVIALQQKQRGWKGQIVTNPNCSTVVLVMALAALKPFGIQRVIVTTMQAISGAGYPGVASMDINANVVPFIGGEEDKMQQETQKILGDFTRHDCRTAGGEGQRALQSRSGGGWAHHHGVD